VNRAQVPAEQQRVHRRFQESTRPHVLMLTTHGVHEWRVTPGLPDTGGQNVFVNQLSQALVEEGYRVTIANRGGYPHPLTHERRQGMHYKDQFQRLVLLEDGDDVFIRKEDMGDHVHDLARSLAAFLDREDDGAGVIISHYWDAARVGQIYNHGRSHPLPHIWVPHSLGMVKKRNVSEQQGASLRIGERIGHERRLLAELPTVTATSSRIKASLLEDYGYKGAIPFLPPCVDPNRYQPRSVEVDDEIWRFLAGRNGIQPDQLQAGKIITEISRTDKTKRKDVLLKAVARVLKEEPGVYLILSIDPQARHLAQDLKAMIAGLGIEDHVVVVGSVWERLPEIYAISDIYCTPSVMEGFGMSAQEAAACGVPIVASELVPFVEEFLLGEQVKEIPCPGCSRPLRMGEGAISVAADDIQGFAGALLMLLRDQGLREGMGERAFATTIPSFTWPSRTQAFLHDAGLKPRKDE
jgi:mannosylfructose-phosphate synthase